MTTAHFQHIKTSMVDEVAVVEILPKELVSSRPTNSARSCPWSAIRSGPSNFSST